MVQDVLETLTDDAPSIIGKDLLDVFGKDVLSNRQNARTQGAKRIQLQILAEMMAIDAERAVTTMKAWATYIQLASSQSRSVAFATLDEYLPCRITDFGELYATRAFIWLPTADRHRFLFGLLTFGMALTIPTEEMALCKELMRPAFAAITLTNDLFSWEKEHEAAQKAGESQVVNAVWVLMREYSTDETRAREICRDKIKENVAYYLRIVDDTKRNLSISSDLAKYLDALQYLYSGNLIWSMHCPRYHPEFTYNQQQQKMMIHGSGSLRHSKAWCEVK